MEGVRPNGHAREEELIAHYYGCEEPGAETGAHVAGCAECREALEQLKSELAVVSQLETPRREAGYEDQVWARLTLAEPALGRRRGWWRMSWGLPRVLALTGAMAALVAVSFLAGRYSQSVTAPVAGAGNGPEAQKSVLAAALEGHLASSERILLDVVNSGVDGTGWDSQRVRAEALVDANRLYRLTAGRQGQLALESVLEDLERVLIELAHAPEGTHAGGIQDRILDQELVFKLRILQFRLREQPPAARADRKG
ncbi:MAG: hypothetical protein J0L64_03400 [Acidobacteria bacterium]|nr:hypothetical protein [Acidobacteriota bacterium]